MSFRTNLKETPVRPGKFWAEIRATREMKTKNGDPMVVIDWELLDGPDLGRIVAQFVAFVPQMVGRNNHFLRLLGQPHGDDVDVQPDEWVGRKAIVTVSMGPRGMNVSEIEGRPAADAGDTGDLEAELPF